MLAGRGAFPGAVPAGNGKRRARHGAHPSDPPPGGDPAHGRGIDPVRLSGAAGRAAAAL